AENMGARQRRAVARHAGRLERGRPRRGHDAPAGGAAAEPGHRLDRGARNRAISRGARYAAALLAVAAGITRLPGPPGAVTEPAAARSLGSPGDRWVTAA